MKWTGGGCLEEKPEVVSGIPSAENFSSSGEKLGPSGGCGPGAGADPSGESSPGFVKLSLLFETEFSEELLIHWLHSITFRGIWRKSNFTCYGFHFNFISSIRRPPPPGRCAAAAPPPPPAPRPPILMSIKQLSQAVWIVLRNFRLFQQNLALEDLARRESRYKSRDLRY